MGQYHSIYNLDKKECLVPHAMGDGAKLLEWVGEGAILPGLSLLLANSNGRGGGDYHNPREYTKTYKRKNAKRYQSRS